MATRKQGFLQYLYATLTQGSNDAFVQTQIATALLNVSGVAYRLRELVIEYGAAGGASGVGTIGNAGYDVSLTTKSMSAQPNLTEKSQLWKAKHINAFTTSGMAIFEQVYRYQWSTEDNLLIVEDPVYMQLDSNGSSASNVVYARIGYEAVSISDIDKLLIMNSRTVT